jgi:hypothetical protein
VAQKNQDLDRKLFLAKLGSSLRRSVEALLNL